MVAVKMPALCLDEVHILCVPDCLAELVAVPHAILLTGYTNVHSSRASTLGVRYSVSVCQPFLSASLASCLPTTRATLNLDRKNMHVLVHAYLSAKQV